MKELLQKFCAPDSPQLSAPWSEGNWSVASGDHVAIRVPRLAEIVRAPPFDRKIPWVPTVAGEWVGLPAYVLPALKRCGRCRGNGRISTCPECGGDGFLEFNNAFNSYEVDCDSCDGHGDVSGSDNPCSTCAGLGQYCPDDVVEIPFYGHKINAILLEKIKELPDLQLFTAPTDERFYHFTFTGGMGVFTGLSDHEDDQS